MTVRVFLSPLSVVTFMYSCPILMESLTAILGMTSLVTTDFAVLEKSVATSSLSPASSHSLSVVCSHSRQRGAKSHCEPGCMDSSLSALHFLHWLLIRLRAQEMPTPPHSLHLLLCRFCSQILVPPHSWHALLLRLCSQALAPLHSLLHCRIRLCSCMPFPSRSQHSRVASHRAISSIPCPRRSPPTAPASVIVQVTSGLSHLSVTVTVSVLRTNDDGVPRPHSGDGQGARNDCRARHAGQSADWR